MKKLAAQAFAKAGAGLLLCALLLFGPAGTLHWVGAWRFLAALFLPMVVVGVVLLCKAPELLKKRLNAKEEQAAQKGVILVSALLFVADFVLCGLDYRFGWSALPGWLGWAAVAAFLLGYALSAALALSACAKAPSAAVEESPSPGAEMERRVAELAQTYASGAYFNEEWDFYLGGYREGDNDELWQTAGDRGTNIYYCGTLFTEPETQPDGSVTFWQLSLQLDEETFAGWEGEGPYVPAFAEPSLVRLVPTENGWRVAQLSLPY